MHFLPDVLLRPPIAEDVFSCDTPSPENALLHVIFGVCLHEDMFSSWLHVVGARGAAYVYCSLSVCLCRSWRIPPTVVLTWLTGREDGIHGLRTQMTTEEIYDLV